MNKAIQLVIPIALALAPQAHAQFTIPWSTVDCGGGISVGGSFTLSGTIGQPDAGSMSGGAFTLGGGYWAAGGVACYPNCDHSTIPPVLNVQDFACFLNAFALGDPTYANCDHSTTPPVLNVQDFSCFLNAFAAGCS